MGLAEVNMPQGKLATARAGGETPLGQLAMSKLVETRRMIEQGQKYGSITQGTRPMSLSEELLHGAKEMIGLNAIRRGMDTAKQFKGKHGIMNPATVGDYALANVNMVGNALEATLAGMDVAAVAGPTGRLAASTVEKAIVANPGLFPDTQAGMVAWHGSPHKFPPSKDNPLGEFDLGKMGSGEGAQAYGWGTYLAEGKGTAKNYQMVLGGQDYIYKVNGKPVDIMGMDWADKNAIEAIVKPKTYGTKGEMLERLEDNGVAQADLDKFSTSYDKYKGKVEYSVEDKGHLYEVDLPDTEIDKMLDWDKPLSEQPEMVKKLRDIEDIHPQIAEALQSFELKASKGSTVYHILQESLGSQERASKELKALGIPGLKFLDQASRDAGKGTRNFVVFDPKKAEIVGRN